jgi:hypothetical protein
VRDAEDENFNEEHVTRGTIGRQKQAEFGVLNNTPCAAEQWRFAPKDQYI